MTRSVAFCRMNGVMGTMCSIMCCGMPEKQYDRHLVL